MKKLAVMILGCSAFFSTQSTLAGDAAAGEAKSATCVACHGAKGCSTNPSFPKIAGQHEAYIEKQLNDFKGDKRTNGPMMAPMAKGLSEDDVKNLAAYFSAQSCS